MLGGIIKVEQGKALIVSDVFSGKVRVSFTGGFVWPVTQRAEVMDISLKTLKLDRSGADSLTCRDDARVDVKVTFFVRVNKTEGDIIRVAQSIGCARTSKPELLEELFAAKFSEALEAAVTPFDFVDLRDQREQLRDRIIEFIGTDLDGFCLEDCAVDHLGKTPMTELDKPDSQAAS